MSDLREIRRYWPWTRIRWPASAITSRRRNVSLSCDLTDEFSDGLYWKVYIGDGRHSPQKARNNPWTKEPCKSVTSYGLTIAAAMSAAGFGERKKGFFAEYNEVDTAVWLRVTKRHADKYAGKTRIPLESSQRPRKGVRLGKRRRRLALAASIGEALELVGQARRKRTDRMECE